VPGVNVLPSSFYLPIGSGQTLYQGGLAVFVTTTGLEEASTGQAGVVVGRVAVGNGGQSVFTNTAGNANYASSATVEPGCFLWNNTSSLTTLANFGALVYADSDQSVTSTAGSNAKAGYFVGVDSATGTQAMVVTYLGAFGAN
jgi:hypothetical protein